MGNYLRTTILLALMTALILWLGQFLGGRLGMLIALIIAGGMNFFSYWFSDKIVLRMYRAQEATAQQAPELHRMVATLAQRAQLPMPKVYIIPNDAPNAFATGRNPQHAVVAVTQGLLANMDRRQVMGVLAHEMAHVKNRDILIGSIAATLAGAITWLANMMQWGAMFGSGRNSDEEGGGSSAIGLLLMSIVAPFAAMIIQMAVSRSREYQADALGAQLAGEREGLASALERLGALSRRVPLDANPSTAHMFIVNPLSGRSLMSLFSTHPAIEERVARLRGGRIQPQSPTPSPPPVNKGSIEEEGRSFWNKLS